MTTHTVQSGETLSSIAKQYLGSSSKYMEIANFNNLSDPNKISVGMQLNIPDGEPQVQVSAAPEISSEPISGDGAFINAEQLAAIIGNEERAAQYVDALNQGFAKFGVNTPLRIAHFVAQVAHESANFKATSENLNYSAKALGALFGKYFQGDEAEQYARKPEQIANRIYANRMGNGDEASGEGWKYRGRGLIQLTGKDNYSSFSSDYGTDVVAEPDQVSTDPVLCVASALWYWNSRKLNQYADEDDIKTITKRINGGYHGLEDRQEKLDIGKDVLGV